MNRIPDIILGCILGYLLAGWRPKGPTSPPTVRVHQLRRMFGRFIGADGGTEEFEL